MELETGDVFNKTYDNMDLNTVMRIYVDECWNGLCQALLLTLKVH